MMSTMKGVIFLAVVLWRVTSADIIKHRSCSGAATNQASNVTVDVTNCTNGENCTLVRGNTYYLTTIFSPTTDTCALKLKIWGIFRGMRVPYQSSSNICDEVSSSDGGNCSNCGGVKVGNQYEHKASFPVRRYYPLMDLTVRVMYYESKRHNIFCFEVPVSIVSNPQT